MADTDVPTFPTPEAASHWKRATAIESYGRSHLGVELRVLAPIVLTDDERLQFGKCVREADKLLHRIVARHDPERPAQIAELTEKMRALFPPETQYKTIPNGYCSDWCCEHRPWFVFMTRIGPITIGWRKRVITIDWSLSLVEARGHELFADQAEMTTVGGCYDEHGRYIHAWGYEKAREYVDRMLTAMDAAAAEVPADV